MLLDSLLTSWVISRRSSVSHTSVVSASLMTHTRLRAELDIEDLLSQAVCTR